MAGCWVSSSDARDINTEARMETMERKERRLVGGSMDGVIIAEFGLSKKGGPVVLLIVREAAQVLLATSRGVKD